MGWDGLGWVWEGGRDRLFDLVDVRPFESHLSGAYLWCFFVSGLVRSLARWDGWLPRRLVRITWRRSREHVTRRHAGDGERNVGWYCSKSRPDLERVYPLAGETVGLRASIEQTRIAVTLCLLRQSNPAGFSRAAFALVRPTYLYPNRIAVAAIVHTGARPSCVTRPPSRSHPTSPWPLPSHPGPLPVPSRGVDPTPSAYELNTKHSRLRSGPSRLAQRVRTYPDTSGRRGEVDIDASQHGRSDTRKITNGSSCPRTARQVSKKRTTDPDPNVPVSFS
jgi:hypothetical protein